MPNFVKAIIIGSTTYTRDEQYNCWLEGGRVWLTGYVISEIHWGLLRHDEVYVA